MSEGKKVTPTDDPKVILKLLHDFLAAKFGDGDLHQKAGRVLDATNSDHTGCYTDGASDSD